MKKIISLLFITVLILPALCLCSCQRELLPCEYVLSAMLSEEKNLPSGDIYLSTCSEGDEYYTHHSLLSALYGNGSTPPQSEGWIEFAIFLSAKPHPCEFAVFLCDSPESVHDTSIMLSSRLDTLKKAWAESQYSAYVENARVTVKDNYCFLIVSADSKSAERAATSAAN